MVINSLFYGFQNLKLMMKQKKKMVKINFVIFNIYSIIRLHTFQRAHEIKLEEFQSIYWRDLCFSIILDKWKWAEYGNNDKESNIDKTT